MDSLTDAQIPTSLPVLPGVVLSGQYGISDREPAHRGDTLGSYALPDRRVLMVVADVVGHGVRASLAGAQVQAMLWSQMADGADLVDAVGCLDRHARRNADLTATRLVVAVLDLVAGELSCVVAGLSPPLVLSPHHRARELATGPTRPLGIVGPRRVHRTRMGADEMVLLSTAGVSARGGVNGGPAQGRLVGEADRVLDASADSGVRLPQRADEVCRSVLTRPLATELEHDDVAVLIAQRAPQPPPLSVTIDAADLDVSDLRGLLSGWLDALGVGLVDHIGLGHAVVEMASNVAKHAYAGTASDPRPIHLEVCLDDTGQIVATVTDRGRWHVPEDPGGRGLTMIGGLMDHVEVRRAPGGTSVLVRTRVGRPVQLWEADGAPPLVDGTPVALPDEVTTVVAPGSLSVAGPVDEASADIFHSALLEATRAGTRASTVDLSEVTHLSSSGVRSLLELEERTHAAGVDLDIFAPRHTTARQVLDLVGLTARP